MKTSIISLFAVILVAITVLQSCKKDDNSQSTASTATILNEGTWRVSYYHDNSSDHTSEFTGYSFTFFAAGTMSSMCNGIMNTGTWSCDDSSKEFHCNIGSTSPLSDLDKGWMLTSKTNNEIILKDDNSGSLEELHLTKN